MTVAEKAIWYVSNLLLTIISLAVAFGLNSAGLLLYSVGYGFDERTSAEACFVIDGLGPASGLPYGCFTGNFIGATSLLLLLCWVHHPMAQAATVLVSLLFGQYLFIWTAWGAGATLTGGASKAWGEGITLPTLIIGLLVLINGAGLRTKKIFGLPSEPRPRLLAWGVVIMFGVVADILLILARCPKLKNYHRILTECDEAFHSAAKTKIWPVDGWTFQGVDAIMWSQMWVDGCAPQPDEIATAYTESQSVSMLPFPVAIIILAAFIACGIGIVFTTPVVAARDACADSDKYFLLK